MKFEIKHCSVLDAGSEIIVNAANNYLSCGGGVCGAIFAKAGDLELEAECKEYRYVQTGSVAVTNGLKTGAKYIIHAVGPNFYIDKYDWQEKLANAYRNALFTAEDAQAKSIAFPCISTGIFGCPFNEATHIALNEIACHEANSLEVCYLCCYTDVEYKEYTRISYLYEKSNFELFSHLVLAHPKTEQEERDNRMKLDKLLKDMYQITWEDLSMVPKESLVNIPISWIWDWGHCCAMYEKQHLAESLYREKNLPIITVQFIERMKNMNREDKEKFINKLREIDERR